jgi:hypothetical protein
VADAGEVACGTPELLGPVEFGRRQHKPDERAREKCSDR